MSFSAKDKSSFSLIMNFSIIIILLSLSNLCELIIS